MDVMVVKTRQQRAAGGVENLLVGLDAASRPMAAIRPSLMRTSCARVLPGLCPV